MKEDVRIVSKTSPPFSFLLNRNALDMAEEEEKHGKQKEDPPLLWPFMPLRYQTEHVRCSLRRNCNRSTSCSFRVAKKYVLTSVSQK